MRNVIKAGSVALVLTTALAAQANAEPFEDGQAAYEQKDYATALRLWRPLADQGYAKAQRTPRPSPAGGEGGTRREGEGK